MASVMRAAQLVRIATTKKVFASNAKQASTLTQNQLHANSAKRAVSSVRTLTLAISVMLICTSWLTQLIKSASAIVSAFGILLKLMHGPAIAKETTCCKMGGAYL